MTEMMLRYVRNDRMFVSFRMTEVFVYSGGLIMSVLNDRDVLLLIMTETTLILSS